MTYLEYDSFLKSLSMGVAFAKGSVSEWKNSPCLERCIV